MSGDRPDIWKLADQIQMNLRVLTAQIVELRAMLAALNITSDTRPARAGSPRELVTGVCPACHVGPAENGAERHAADCDRAWREAAEERHQFATAISASNISNEEFHAAMARYDAEQEAHDTRTSSDVSAAIPE